MTKYFNNVDSLDSLKREYLKHKKAIKIPMGCTNIIENLPNEDAGQLIKAIVSLCKYGDDSLGKAIKNEQSELIFQMFADFIDYKFSQRYMRSVAKSMNQTKSE